VASLGRRWGHKSAVGLYDLTSTTKFGKGHAKVVATQKWALQITM
jgi:hypothetical protein